MWKWLLANKVWPRVRPLVRRGFLVAFVAIWTAVGASLYATGNAGNGVFWLFYVAVWAWYIGTVLVPDVRRRRAVARYSDEVR